MVAEKYIMVRNEELIAKLIKIGFSITEAWNLIHSLGLVEPFVIVEEPGICVINDYALQRIQVE